MSSLPRHPRLWPRMKVRGHRRLRLAAQRRTTVYAFPNMSVVDDDDGDDGTVTLGVDGGPPGTPDAMAVSVRIVRDGLGRSVADTRSPLRAKSTKPVPQPRPRVGPGVVVGFAPVGTPPPTEPSAVNWKPLGSIASIELTFKAPIYAEELFPDFFRRERNIQ